MAMTAIEWNRSNLQQYLWDNLGARKHAVGRKFVDRATNRIIARWPFGQVQDDELPSRNDPQFKRMADEVKREMRSCEGSDQTFGFVIWTIILSAVISQLVKLLIEWWLKRRENRTTMGCIKLATEVGALDGDK